MLINSQIVQYGMKLIGGHVDRSKINLNFDN